ncbi:MAG: hypothetical protein RL328_443 [Acidobacteriota bacterium]|jgi:hypothetical protein
MRTLPLLLLFASLCAGEIVPAYGHIPGGGFRVPLPDSQIPWKDVALQVIGKDAATPSETRITDLWQNKDNFGITEVNFQAPVPAAMKTRKFYVISDGGLSPLKMRGLVGGIRYGFDIEGEKAAVLKQVAFTGNAMFDNVPEDEYVEGAFLIDSDTEIKSTAAEVQPSAVSVAKEGETTRIGWNGKSGAIKSPTTSRPDAATAITIGNDQYLYLQWHPEGTSCEFIFTLLKANATGLQETANTVYGCDF